MNYRHAYHAGNFADCFKHALLVGLLNSFVRKPTPFFVLDTHAGAGRYDPRGEMSCRTGEIETGIYRLLGRSDPVLGRYLGLVERCGLYPGSPALIRAVMRGKDRLACCELHPEDLTILRRHFAGDRQVEVHHRSGWDALAALLPPREKVGLVFVDPPFEASDEFSNLSDGLAKAHSRFRHGVFAAWYPVKHHAAVRDFYARLTATGIADIIAVELCLRETMIPVRLDGCGLVVINPPYRFEECAGMIACAILDGLRHEEVGGGTAVIRLANE